MSTYASANTTYYVDPIAGDDANSGTDESQSWCSFAPLNRLFLAPGDRVEIIAPGAFEDSLVLKGRGTAEAPITVRFAPGRYDFHPTHALRRRYYISNCNGDPEGEKAIGIMVENAGHVHLHGPGARIVYRGKMIELCIDHAEAVTVSGFQFDYHRPTVSELTVVAATDVSAELAIHRDSAYRVENGELVWEGEGWTCGPDTEALLAQELAPETGRLRRCRNPLEGLRIEAVAPHRVRAVGEHNMPLNHVFQFRDGRRDCVGVFVNRSRVVTFRDVHFAFLHGMGVLCQFSENITLESVTFAPDADSGRTCAAWADCLHASGCRGKITVRDCLFSGAQDDAINVHGTHLRIVEEVSRYQVKMRFMHRQTYGFMAFAPGDEIDFVRWNSLETYAPNTVAAVEMLNPRELLLTLEQPVPEDWQPDDTIENVTWTPEAEVRGCRVRHIPTRGFLLTTRRKVVVEDNLFDRTWMSAILVETDAEGWFESGCVRDMTITGNRFVDCGKAVVCINPRNTTPNSAVHRDIRILDNEFVLGRGVAVQARGTTGLTIAGNTVQAESSSDGARVFVVSDCLDVEIGNNSFVEETNNEQSF